MHFLNSLKIQKHFKPMKLVHSKKRDYSRHLGNFYPIKNTSLPKTVQILQGREKIKTDNANAYS